MRFSKAEKAAKRCSARGLPKVEQLPGRLDFDANSSPLALQARLLANRFGLAPGIAELVAGLAFQTGALR